MVGGQQQQQQDQYSIEELASGGGHGAGPKSGWSLEHRKELAGGSEVQSEALRSWELLLCMTTGKATGTREIP